MRIGLVGSEGAKFTAKGKRKAMYAMFSLLQPGDIVVSGHCHLGGVDIWAEQIAALMGLDTDIYPPETLSWETGYKPRNIQIAENSELVVCIAVDRLPPTFTGMRHELCYHCHTADHVKSGGCWTTKYARKIGKSTDLIIVPNDL